MERINTPAPAPGPAGGAGPFEEFANAAARALRRAGMGRASADEIARRLESGARRGPVAAEQVAALVDGDREAIYAHVAEGLLTGSLVPPDTPDRGRALAALEPLLNRFIDEGGHVPPDFLSLLVLRCLSLEQAVLRLAAIVAEHIDRSPAAGPDFDVYASNGESPFSS